MKAKKQKYLVLRLEKSTPVCAVWTVTLKGKSRKTKFIGRGKVHRIGVAKNS